MLFKAKGRRNEGLADELIKKNITTKLVKPGIGPKHHSQANGDQIPISLEDFTGRLG